jgi:NAD(P)-dependent dehydrogenase (short-subunit alcohol dehydrogenase family)
MISDLNIDLAQKFADEHNAGAKAPSLFYVGCDTSLWDSQLSAFQTALRVLGGRIDFVAPIAGIGEKKWLPTFDVMGKSSGDDFVKPDLSVIDVDLTGVLYTIALAVQQFRRQEPVSWLASSGVKYRGKIGLVASVCGFYCVPSLPIYTAAKHAMIGLTRSYGVLLKDEGMTLGAVAPNVVRTSISSGAFYDQMEELGLLTPMDGVLDAFTDMLQTDGSGEIYECGTKGGWTKRRGAEYLDAESERCCELLLQRGMALH